ncbi:response regulator transcription factor [Cohnella abietis]|uniref:DNA-binding response regulator n=1 Tax=Cohnella abietis TaxID=2507935 RepID=A0A3T1D1R5_9BACL|nr:response regulator [Cohnella abietis]BBI31959.1 DNA-binding response regulator [Cohnella abietis]
MLNIALVDDEDTILFGMTKLISEMNDNYHVIATFNNGQEVLDSTLLGQFDLLITDIKMPCMDGLELIKEVVLHYPDLPCLIVSGFSEFDYARTAMRYGVIDYLLKPVDPDELNEKLSSILQAKQPLVITQIDGDKNKAIRLVKNWISAHYDSELDMSALAELVHLNPNYLSRLFKIETGESLTGYLIHTRMQKAKELLVNQLELKIYEIAERIGYNDSTYFTKLFKKLNGYTPLEYRNKQ